ncbi:bifunctional UDP-N-acetylmuramoyl-tripeptide:D-alanyl-D-alanine ligase/alanine racemase [Reichenbachiella versicolor]|uniref:bifunctional UDP-N-acetylmuramoyl-tripeptide:D-alanyl-D-alanine ligase/alanine racemase n=1 Tax=Reichenbachiella versicolor TaxID=1821036 RepID=UPI000D6E092A|nr:bifunctional UDP-N-acetylmuramoyl-tripeptide:D-alanyl-D-alanine ligase/alanine racemase [Reichenbachiella versicolor]
MKFSQIDQITTGDFQQVSSDVEIRDLVTDTRNIAVGQGVVFFAIEGKNHDGHQFVSDAYTSGARCFVVEKPVKLPEDASVFIVNQSLDALQDLAKAHRAQFNYPVVAVTGSNGKTIVKEWLAQMLDYKYSIVKSPKSYNSQLGVPLSVWQMSGHHNVAIFEAGISRKGEMGKLESIIKPSVGIFTNIGEAHNAGFDSHLEKAREKAQLFKGTKKIIYCEDHKVVKEALTSFYSADRLVGWSISENKGRKFKVKIGEQELDLRLKFTDHASVENCVHCAVTLHVFGFGVELIQQRLDTLSTVKMRLEMKQAVNRSYIIDDTYNNDLYGLEIAISFLNSQKQRTKKTVILSDLYQTGLDQKVLYRKVDNLLKANKVQRLIGVGAEISAAQDAFTLESNFYPDTESFLSSDLNIHDEIVLIKGARDFKFERIVDRYEYKVHGTVLEVNLEKVTNNLNYYRSKLKEETKIMVMVKAFAYGGGNFEIANLLQYHKVDYLGVAYTDEAVELRKNGVHLPIMIMNASMDSFRLIKEYNLEPEIYSLEQFYDFTDYFENEEVVPAIHIKLETGMNRLGFKENELNMLIDQLKVNKDIKVKSIFSHLAGSEDPRHKEFTVKQVSRFEQMSLKVMDALWYKPMRHIVNSGGISRYPEYQFDMVRLGIGLYGFDPSQSDDGQVQPIGTLKSFVSQVKLIPAGESIGYGRAGFAQSDMQIAVVPIGYADGYIRAFGNGKGQMMINGSLVSTVGNICMDMTMIDVTDVKVKSGDEVIVFGENPTIKDLSDWIGTIPYEILTNISQRVKRVYSSE